MKAPRQERHAQSTRHLWKVCKLCKLQTVNSFTVELQTLRAELLDIGEQLPPDNSVEARGISEAFSQAYLSYSELPFSFSRRWSMTTTRLTRRSCR